MDSGIAGDAGPAVPPAITELCAEPAGWSAQPSANTPVPFRQGSYAALDFDLAAVRYASALDRFVAVSAKTPALRVFDANGNVSLNVTLSAAPTAVSVAPNGSRAAVGHSKLISMVDLGTGAVTTISFPAPIRDILDVGGDWLYVTPAGSDGSQYTQALFSVEIATGTVIADHSTISLGYRSPIAWRPAAHRIYIQGDSNGGARYDVSGGAATFVSGAPMNPIAFCDDAFVSSDATELMTGCGRVIRLDDDPVRDETYKTSLGFENTVVAAADSAKRGQYAVLFDQVGPGSPLSDEVKRRIRSEVYVFDDEYFEQRGAATLPEYQEAGQSAPLWGNWVTYSSDGAHLYVVAETPSDSSLAGRAAIVTLPGELAEDPSTPTLDGEGPFHLLGASVIDARYSRELERIVLVTKTPAKLVVLDPRTQTQQEFDLPRAPLDLELDPAGRHAIVVFDGWVSYYEIEPLSMLRTFELPGRPGDNSSALDDSGHLFVDWGIQYLSANLATGDVQITAKYDIEAMGRYVPAQHAFFYARGDVLVRIAADGTTLGPATQSSADYAACSRWWPSVDGGRAFGACGHVYTLDADMLYRGTIPGFVTASYSGYNFIDHLDDSSAARAVALIQSSNYGRPGTSRDVRLHEDEYFAPLGSVRLPAFSAAGTAVPAYPRYVFFSNDGDRLDILAQADPNLGIDADYGLMSADLTHLVSCLENSPSTPIPVTGNQQGSATLLPLAFDIVDAAYDSKNDRIVVVSSDPPAVEVIDPQTAQSIAKLDLPLSPTRVVLEPGAHAAVVGHDGWLSRVSLDTPEVMWTHSISTNAWGLAATGGRAYVVPYRDQFTPLRVVELADASETRGSGFYAQSRTWVSPDGLSLLTLQGENSSDDSVHRISLVDAAKSSTSFGQGGNAVVSGVGHALWFASDGQRLFGSSGAVFDLSDPQAASFTKLGTLAGVGAVRALDHSAALGLIAAVPRQYQAQLETQVALFDDATYAKLQTYTLPAFLADTSSVGTHGLFVFFSKNGNEIYVLVEVVTEQSYSSRFGLVRIPVPT